MRYLLLITIGSILLFSCRSKESIPSDILPKAKMQTVLADMMRTDQFLNDYVFSRDTSLDKMKESVQRYQKVFSIHNVSKEEFQRSFSYYRSNPILFKELMDSIGNRSFNTPSTAPAVPTLTDTARKKFNVPVRAN